MNREIKKLTDQEKMELRSKTDKEFNKIEEESRTYTFPGGERVTVNDVTHIHVSANGHRLLDRSGLCHYVPFGWIHLYWRVGEGHPHFSL